MPLTAGAQSIAQGTGDSCFEGGEALASEAGACGDILAQKADGYLLESVCEPAVTGAPLRLDAEIEVVDTLVAAAQLVAFAHDDGLDTNAGERRRGLQEAIAGSAQEAVVEGLHPIRDIVQGGSDQLGGGGRGGGTQVGNEVGDGEVGLVADGGNDWEGRGGDGIGEEFAVERCKVFERSAATGNDDEVDFACAVEVRDSRRDFGRRRFTLNERGIEQDVECRMAPIDDVEEVAEYSAGG